MSLTLWITACVLAALSPLTVFGLGYAFVKRSQKPIGKVQDAAEFLYLTKKNADEYRAGITTMAIALLMWGGLVWYRCVT